MAAVLEQTKPAGPLPGSQVEEQIAQATSRIRAHDLAFGALVLVGLVLAYTTAMILLDKYLVLPEVVRQFALGSFGVVLTGAAYFTIVRPLRRRINPIYAAVQVEKTIDDAKNSVVGYVEAQEREDVHPTVRAAMGVRAAKSMTEADLNRAVDHRSLLWAGGVGAVLLLALVVLFFVFRLNQFGSLVGRTFIPFSSDPIATRTRLELVKPSPPDATITAGQPITISATIRGKLPDPNGPDKVRLLIRHNPNAAEYVDVAMEAANRTGADAEWEVRVPDHLVQNGFWYKVAAGDAVTAEHRVTVQSRPLFTDFDLTYEYQPYLRRKPVEVKNPNIEVIAGSRVTVVAKTNREVEFTKTVADKTPNRLEIKPTGPVVVGQVVAGKPDSVRFVIPSLTAGESYQLHFTAKGGEKNTDPPAFGIKLIADTAPQVAIDKPAEEEIPLPANGQLAVDGKIGDDQGIDRVTLKLRLKDGRELAGKPFLNGKSPSFLRQKDNTWPTDLEYKDSVELGKLTELDGKKPVVLTEGMVLEYWLEAEDNRTEWDAANPYPATVRKPNVGRSEVKRVRVGPPTADPEEQKNQEQQQNDRRRQEQKHNQDQQQKLDKQDRPKPGENPPKPEGNQGGDPMNQQGNPPPKNQDNGGGMDPQPPMIGDMGMQQPMPGANPPMPMNDTGNMGMPPDNMNQGQGGNQPNPDKVNEQARRLEEELKKDREGGGGAKPNNDQPPPKDRNPADQKPQQNGGMGGQPDASQPKEGPKPNDPGMPPPMTGGNDAQPGEQKNEGKVEPTKTSSPKATPPGGDDTNPMSNPNGSEQKPGQPKGQGEEKLGQPQQPAQDKPTPQEKPDPNNPNQQNRDPAGGGEAKPNNPQSKDGGNQQSGRPQQDPGAKPAEQKPGPNDQRGSDREQARQPDAGNPGAQQQPKPDAGDSKPNAKPDPAQAKAGPQKDPMTGNEAASKPKGGEPNNGTKPEEAGEPKANPPGMADNQEQPGTDRPPQPNNNAQANSGTKPKQPDPKTPQNGGGRPLSPGEKQDIANAAKDLNSDDKGKREAAEKKIDNIVGEKARKDAQQQAKQLEKDLNSPDQKTREGAENKVKDMVEQARKEQEKNGGNAANQPKVDPKDAGNAAKDLASDDKGKREAARDKLDQAVGPQARKELEKDAADAKKDMQSGDMNQQAQGQKKLDEIGRKAEQLAKDNPANKGAAEPKKETTTAKTPKVEPKDASQAAKDLASDDKGKQQAARDTLDKAVGEPNRKELEKQAADAKKDMQSGNKDQQAAGQKKLDEAADKAAQMAKENPGNNGQPPPKPRQLTAEEKKQVEELAKKAGDLNSPDADTRAAAEQEFDDKIGKENRENLQEAMKNQKPTPGGDDRQKAEEARKRMEEMAKKGELDDNWWKERRTPGTPQTPTTPAEAMKDDPANRLKAGQLQLEEFKRIRGNPELLNRAGFNSDDEYERFLRGVEERNRQLAKEAEAAAQRANTPEERPLGGPPTINTSGGGGVGARPGGTGGNANVGGTAVAPPGFENAKLKFQRDASKVPAPKK